MARRRSKNILIVSHYYPPHLGGIEFVAQNQAERLAALGHRVTVVTSQVSTAERSGTIGGVRLVRVKAANFLEKHAIPFPLFSPRLLPVLWREVGSADVVHIHDVFYLSSWAAALCAVWRKKPIVLTQHVAAVPHSPAIDLVERTVYASAGALIFRHAVRILTLNDRIEDFVRTYGVSPSTFRFLPIGTDCNKFHPASAAERRAACQKFDLPLDKPIVLFVGRAVPKKGFDKVLAAQSSQYLLVFGGGTFDRKNTARAKFIGTMPQDDLAQLYRVADIFVLPSEGEGFPMSAQEAMASGLPVVLRDDPGYARYQLTPQLVCLIDGADPAVIKRTLIALLGDLPRRQKMAIRARRHAQSHFSWDKLIEELDTIYDEVLLTPKGRI
jgi:D-inositol-3-phosphate glycosyltransferase